jgi:serine/threonine-protein kinase
VSILALLAAAGISVWVFGTPRRSASVTRATIALPATQAPPMALSLYPIVALSPDGQQMVYVASSGKANQLFIRRMNQYEARAIAGTDGAHAPFFSPDGRRVGFFAGRKLKHVSLAGGDAVTVSDAHGGLGGAWTAQRTIIFAPDWTGGLLEVDEGGGTPRTLAESPGGGFGYRWPHILADRNTVIATRWRADEQTAAVVAIARPAGTETVLVRGASSATFLPDDHLVYARAGNLFAARYGPGHAPGPERQVLDDVMVGLTGIAQYAVSSTGSLIYIPHDETRFDRRLFEIGADGSTLALDHELRAFQEISVCHDRLAVSIVRRGSFEVWIGRVTGGALTQLTRTGSAMDPVWRPGCEEVAYSSGNELFLQRADGSMPATRLQDTSLVHAPTGWSPDGARLVYAEVNPATRFDIWILDLASRKPERVVATRATEWLARVSPDGQWLAYQSNETGQTEVFIRPFDSRGGQFQVSSSGGSDPSWSADGRALHYMNRERDLFRHEIDPVTGSPAQSPRRLFRRNDMAVFTPLANGKFLVADRIREHLPITTMNLVVNWREEVVR